MRSKQTPPAQAQGMHMGFRGTRYTQDFLPKPVIKPSEIGYPATQLELETFARKQQQRAQKTLSTEGNGLLTEREMLRIIDARAKRARQAARQSKGAGK